MRSFPHHFMLLYIFSYCLFCQGTITQSPTTACVGDAITVSCVLTPPAGESFSSTLSRFLIGDDPGTLSPNDVSSNISHGNVDLSRFTAMTNSGTLLMVSATITLSYLNSDGGLRLGCTVEYVDSGTSMQMRVMETLQLVQAVPPSPPSNLQRSECLGVAFSWTPPTATDRTLSYYELYRGSKFINITDTTTTEYTNSDQLVVNTSYLYSLSAVSCAGNSVAANITITVSDGQDTIQVRILDNSSINPILSSTLVPVAISSLKFNFTLYREAAEIDTLDLIPFSDINVNFFSEKFAIGVCYRISASVKNCSGGTKSLLPKTFILPGLRNESGEFIMVSKVPLSFAWAFKKEMFCSNLAEHFSISRESFAIKAYRIETQEEITIMNATFNTLNLPYNFSFIFPPDFNNSNGTYLFQIFFDGKNLTSEFIPISIISSKPDIIDEFLSRTTIILICIFIFLLILLVIVLALIIILFYIRWLRSPGEKKCPKIICRCLYVMMCLCLCKKMCPGLYEKMCPCLGEENCPCHCIREKEPEEEKRPYN